MYGTGPSNDPKNLMGKIWERATEMGLPVESINGEYDNGQFELTLSFDEALKACDNAFLFKTMAKEIALRRVNFIFYAKSSYFPKRRIRAACQL